MIKDIIRGDECAQQIAISDSLLKISEAKFVLLSDENSILKRKYAACEQSNQDYYYSNEVNLNLNKDLKTKNSRIKRQRNVLLGFTAILTAIVIKNIIDDNE